MEEAVGNNSRGLTARIGICALNLLLPGLGLLRLARYRLGAFFFALYLAASALAIGGYCLIEKLDFREWAGLIGSTFALALVAYLGSIAASWRAGKVFEARSGIAWRWYAVMGVWLAVVFASWPLTDLARSHYRGFYIPGVAMLPTMQLNDRYLADMHAIDPIARGDIVIAHVDGVDYAKRVAGLPGDRIALANGIVVLNGKPIAQEFVETVPLQMDLGVLEAKISRERFPGEIEPHLVADTGPGFLDDIPETLLPPGRYYLLGDNRDHSSDSRLPPGPESGLGAVPRGAIIGRIAFRYWRKGAGFRPGKT